MVSAPMAAPTGVVFTGVAGRVQLCRIPLARPRKPDTDVGQLGRVPTPPVRLAYQTLEQLSRDRGHWLEAPRDCRCNHDRRGFATPVALSFLMPAAFGAVCRRPRDLRRHRPRAGAAAAPSLIPRPLPLRHGEVPQRVARALTRERVAGPGGRPVDRASALFPACSRGGSRSPMLTLVAAHDQRQSFLPGW